MAFAHSMLFLNKYIMAYRGKILRWKCFTQQPSNEKENNQRNRIWIEETHSNTLTFIPFHAISMCSLHIHFTHSDFILTHYLLTIHCSGSLINRIQYIFSNVCSVYLFLAVQLTIHQNYQKLVCGLLLCSSLLLLLTIKSDLLTRIMWHILSSFLQIEFRTVAFGLIRNGGFHDLNSSITTCKCICKRILIHCCVIFQWWILLALKLSGSVRITCFDSMPEQKKRANGSMEFKPKLNVLPSPLSCALKQSGSVFNHPRMCKSFNTIFEQCIRL